jgi:hypothetical protein
MPCSSTPVTDLLIGQERPCKRCVRRNVGHLCHDEPREGVKRSKTDPETANGDGDASKHDITPTDTAVDPITQGTNAPDAGLNLALPPLAPDRGASAPSMAQSAPVSAPQLPALTSQSQSSELHVCPALNVSNTE